MRTSESINEISKALSEAQKTIQKAHKETTNPFFKSKYADLASNWDACREALTKNNLAVVQTTESASYPQEGEKNQIRHILHTRLVHTSGQWFESMLILTLSKQDMQGVGSALTYARRYHLQAIVGISPTDDDAEGCVNHKNGKTEVAMPKATQSSRISPLKADYMVKLAKEMGYTKDDFKERIGRLGYKTATDILTQDYDTLVSEFQVKKSDRPEPDEPTEDPENPEFFE